MKEICNLLKYFESEDTIIEVIYFGKHLIFVIQINHRPRNAVVSDVRIVW